MNSSTSSSNADSRHEWKVVLVALLAVAACELAMRSQAHQYLDEQHRLELPSIAAKLSEKPAPRVLMLGNSLTRAGVRLDSFERQLAAHGVQAGGLAKANPDDTAVSQWRAVYENYFASRDRGPDCVVVSFVGEHLADQSGSRSRLTARFVGSMRQMVDVLRHDVDSFDDGADLLAAYWLQSMAYQENAKHRVLSALIPHYQHERQRLNQLRRSVAAAERARSGKRLAYTYHRLDRFIQSLKEHGCQGVFCRMPIPGTQLLDERLVERLNESSMIFVDLRTLIENTRGHYPDSYHMDETAADIYSRAVADELARRLPAMWRQR
jgi:hypothetical protein